MKLLVLMLVLGSISLLGANKFMTPEEIKNEFEKFNGKTEMMEYLSDDALKRLNILVPDSKMLTKEDKLFLRQQKEQKEIKLYQAKGAIDRRGCDNIAISQCGGVCKRCCIRRSNKHGYSI